MQVQMQILWFRQSLEQYGACAPSDTKMGTEVVGSRMRMLRIGNRAAHRPATRVRLSRLTIDLHMRSRRTKRYNYKKIFLEDE
jgi:hypothetical protein